MPRHRRAPDLPAAVADAYEAFTEDLVNRITSWFLEEVKEHVTAEVLDRCEDRIDERLDDFESYLLDQEKVEERLALALRNLRQDGETR